MHHAYLHHMCKYMNHVFMHQAYMHHAYMLPAYKNHGYVYRIMSRVEDDRYVHHTYKDRGQILSIKVEHCRYMDHTHKLSGSSIVDICIIQVSYMNGSGLMLIDTCIIPTYIRVKYHRIIR